LKNSKLLGGAAPHAGAAPGGPGEPRGGEAAGGGEPAGGGELEALRSASRGGEPEGVPALGSPELGALELLWRLRGHRQAPAPALGPSRSP